MVVHAWHACVLSVAFAVGCSSHPGSAPIAEQESDAGLEPSRQDAGLAVIDAAVGSSVEHGTMIDYETLDPVPGLTVSDNGLSTTTDAKGQWSLVVPQGASLQPTVTSSTYSRLLFPEAMAMGVDVDFANVVIPDSNTYNLEESVLGMDTSKALVQIVVLLQPTCASAVGGTVSIASPSGAVLSYFNTAAMPSTSITSFEAVAPGRPVAVVYNIDPSATLTLQLSHPTCKQVPFPVTYGGREYTGMARLSPAEPGGVDSAIVLFLE